MYWGVLGIVGLSGSVVAGGGEVSCTVCGGVVCTGLAWLCALLVVVVC